MKKSQRIAFDINKAKAGAKIVTRCGKPARIVDYAIKGKNYPILGLVDHGPYEIPETFTNEGRVVGYNVDSKDDLFIEEEIKFRRMTNQELSDWLRDAPKEHRELRYAGDKSVYSTYDYIEDEANTPERDVFIRRNHGEWQEPLIEE